VDPEGFEGDDEMTNQADELIRRLWREATSFDAQSISIDVAARIIREAIPEQTDEGENRDEVSKEDVRRFTAEQMRERLAEELVRWYHDRAYRTPMTLEALKDSGITFLQEADRIRAIMRPKPGLCITGRDVHREWRDGMLFQDRHVSPERMQWETLSNRDQALDNRIAARLSTSHESGKEKEG
jgi:hypothetical protein